MSNKLFPVILIAGGLFYAFKDKVELPNFSPEKPAVVISIEREVSEDMKGKMSGLVKIIQDSKATSEQKKIASALWAGNGDVWKQATVNVNSDKLPEYNKELLSVFSVQYPELIGLFPGFSKEVEGIFNEVIGEYPVPMTPEKTKQVSDISYAISWAFTQ